MSFKETGISTLIQIENNLDLLVNLFKDNELKEQMLSSTCSMKIIEDGYEVINKLKELFLEENYYEEIDFAN